MNNTFNMASFLDPRIGFFDQLAPRWDTDCSNPSETLRRLDELEKRLNLHPGQQLLELGCGTGQLTSWLTRRVQPGRVLAADFSAQMLNRAKAVAAEATFEQLDICHNTPTGGPFDVVFCFNAFPHFRDKAAALRNIAKCLVRSGIFTVLHLAGREKLNAFHKGLREPICFDLLPTKQEWIELLEKNQLQLSVFEDEESLFLLQAKRV
jgi:ubiquinone/menaquinone biosynthesis C-methylase UbiE